MGVHSDLADNLVPPRSDNGFTLTISTTARSYSLQKLQMGRPKAPDVLLNNPDRVYLRVHAITANVWVQLKDTKAVTLSRTYAQTEASAEGEDAVVSTQFGEKVEAGTYRDFELTRGKDRYLHVQGDAAGFLECRTSSDPFPGAGA